MAQLMFPNIAGQVQQGFQQGQTLAFNRLAGLAAQNPDQAQNYLGQAAAIDPRMADVLQDDQARRQYIQTQQQAMQQKAQQTQQNANLQKIGSAARYMIAALQTKNPAQIEGAYQAVRPYLAELGQAQGKVPPPQWDPNMESAIYSVAAQTANLFPNDNKLYNLGAGGRLVNGSGQTIANAPYPIQALPSGYGFDKNTGRAVQIPIQGAPQTSDATPSIGLPASPSIIDGSVPAGTQVTQATGQDGTRVAFAFGPDTPDAVKAQTAAESGVVQPNSNPTTLAQVQASKGQMRTLSPDEVKAAGLPAGAVVQASPNGALHVVSKPGGQDGAPMAFGDPTKTGADYLSTLDPQVASQVKALDEGRMQFPSSFALKTPYWQGMLAAVSRYDPSFDYVNYNARVSTRKAFTSGKEAQQVNALNTVAQHLAQLQGYADALGNYSFTPINTAKNAIEGSMGNPAPTNFSRTVLPVAQELERVWRGTGGTEGDIKQWIDNLSSSSSPAQFKGAFQGLSDLIYGKLAALRDQYVQGMGTTANPYQFLSPRTQAIFSHLDSIDAGKFASDAKAGNNVTANAQGAAQPQGSRVSTQAQYDALPSGATYINANDGQTYRKP